MKNIIKMLNENNISISQYDDRIEFMINDYAFIIEDNECMYNCIINNKETGNYTVKDIKYLLNLALNNKTEFNKFIEYI